MTNEIEQKFFDAFGIEPEKIKIDVGLWNNETNKREPLITTISYEYYPNYKGKEIFKGFIYPEITDRILLELICIETQVNKAHNIYSDVENLKEHILVGLRPFTEKCYNQVRELFGEKD
jgi:hypothetical protein